MTPPNAGEDVKITLQGWWSENFTPLGNIVCQFLKEDRHVPTLNQAMVLLGIYSREIKTHLHNSFIPNNKKLEENQMSLNE